MSESLHTKKENKAKIIFVGNYKGGVGKTTSVLNFATHFVNIKNNDLENTDLENNDLENTDLENNDLENTDLENNDLENNDLENNNLENNNRVLVIDLDPQSSLSEILISNNNNNNINTLQELKDSQTLNYILDLSITKIKKYNSINLNFDDNVIQEYSVGGFDFIPSSLYYSNGGLDDLVLRMEDNIEYLSILKSFIDTIINKRSYDYIFIDCPPSNNLITKSMFLMSDYYIIPTILDKVSTNGVTHYINTVEKTYNYYCNEIDDRMLAKHYFGDKPELLCVFINLLRAQVNYEFDDLIDEIKTKTSKDNVVIKDTFINNYIDIARSTESGKTSVKREDYKELTELIFKKIKEKEKKKEKEKNKIK